MSHFDELKEKSLAIPRLSSYLNDGNLTLFLGAGASHGFGLPGWTELVNRLRVKNGLVALADNASSEELQIGVDEVKDILLTDEKLIEATREQLYLSLRDAKTEDILKNPLLISLAALLMGSRRGRIRRVVTLNYDSLLQSTLAIFGFSVHTVHKLPALETNADVTIYHPHGYLPLPTSGEPCSDFIILGKESVNVRLGTVGDPWYEMLRQLLQSSVCLFVGLSPKTLSDNALAPLFNVIGKNALPNRPLGSWMVYEKDPLSPAKLAEYQRYNIYPIEFSTPEEISVLLLDVCKKAGEIMSK